jgi:regulator of protease activity HflC (stomatin/prohibitin superfamily)
MTMWLIALVGLAAVVVFFLKEFVGGFFGLYRIVPLNEAHVRILNNSKKIFCARTGQSAYWYIPFITRMIRLPLSNLSIEVNDIKLNDKDMAKFMCDLVCFVNIADIERAAERLSQSPASREIGFDLQKLSLDFRAIIESIMRTVSTKQTLLEIYKDRSSLDNAISGEVSKVFPQWGLELVDLELKDIKDAEDSTVISDIEAKRAAEVRRDALVKVAQTEQESRIEKAKADEAARTREIERDRNVATQQQQMRMEVARQEKEANTTTIEAKRVMEFGQADINRQVTEKNAEAYRRKLEIEAEGTKKKLTLEAEGEAAKVATVGQANADVVRITKEAEAVGTEKLANAMQKFNDVSLNVKRLDIERDVTIERYRALAASLSNAEIKLIMTGDQSQNLFGLSLDGRGGAQLDQFLNQLDPETKEKIRAVMGGVVNIVTTKPGKAA